MPNFKLVNPLIVGDLKTEVNSNSADNAAKTVWESISQYVDNNVPKFAFTLQDTNSNKLHHFMVKERLVGKKVDFSISPLKLNLNGVQESKLLSEINLINAKLNQTGGEKHKKRFEEDKSSSTTSATDDINISDSSDDDIETESIYEKVKNFKKKNTPISYWWYSPYYYKLEGQVESIYIPSFNLPVMPYVEVSILNLGTALW
jgi:hypothetical protein